MPVLPFATKGAEKVARDLEKIKQTAKEQGDAIEEAGAKWSRTDALVKRINTRQETAQQRYNRLLGETRKAFEGGLGVEAYEKELAQLTDEYENQTGKFKKFKEGSDSAFDTGAITSFLGPLVSVGGLIGVATKGFEEFRQGIQDAVEYGREGSGNIGQLKQLAETQEQYDELIAKAKDFSAITGKSLGESADTVFAIESSGQGENLKTFQDLTAAGVIGSAEGLSASVSAVDTAFEGLAGDAEGIIGKGLQGAKVAIGNLEGVLDAVAQVGGAAVAVNVSPEETIAGVASLSKVTKSTDLARTQLEALLSSASKEGLGDGTGLGSIIDDIQSRNLSDPELIKLLGRKESLKGFRGLVAQRDLFDSTTSDIIEEGRNPQQVAQKLGFVSPLQNAERLRQTAINERNQAAEQASLRDTVLEAAAERKRARTTEQLGAGVAAFDTVLGNIGRAFTPDRLELNDLAKDDSLPELRDAARELKNTATERTAKRQADALERIEQNTRNGGLRGVGG